MPVSRPRGGLHSSRSATVRAQSADTFLQDLPDGEVLRVKSHSGHQLRDVTVKDFGHCAKRGKFGPVAVASRCAQPELRLNKVVEELALVLGLEDGSAGSTQELGPEVGSTEQVPECTVVGLRKLVPSPRCRLFELNRDGVSGRLPGVFSWWLRWVMGVLCRGCRRCGRACADLPGYGIRMPGGLRAWRAGSGFRKWRW